MSTDPRRRGGGGGGGTAPAPAKDILFGEDDDEDIMDVDEVMPEASQFTKNQQQQQQQQQSSSSSNNAQFSSSSPQQHELISRIITPSPYPHHNSGPASSRFRNALNRVTAAPESDVEAWQALMTEVNTCYRNIPNIHAVDAETYPKLDWIESCYGTLFQYFPYACQYYAAIIEMLLAQSARVGEENGPVSDYGMDVPRRSLACEAKVEHIFRTILGVDMDGTLIGENENNNNNNKQNNTQYSGMCVWMVELWLLFIKKVERDARRQAATLPPDERKGHIREATKKAYEAAIVQAGFAHSNHLLWKQYIDFVKSWVSSGNNNNNSTTDHALAQQQMVHLRSVYQRLVCNPMTGLDQLWQEYEAFERGQNEALAQALIAEFAPKYQTARTCYLERNRVYSAVDLQLGRLATPPVEESEEDYSSKMEEEYKLLKLWKLRCSYERTNALRLETPELAKRIRHTFKEMACVLTRHPECWHMWSMWELHGLESRKASRAIAVLQLGQKHIPDCTLLAFAEAQIVELHITTTTAAATAAGKADAKKDQEKEPKQQDCMKVMEAFLERNPNTLGFVLYQQMVRRYKGKEEARKVFAKARRVLSSDVASAETVEGKKDKTGGEADVNTGDKDQTGKKEEDGRKTIMVTNRLAEDIGVTNNNILEANFAATTAQVKPENGNNIATTGSEASKVKPGPVTWHLYASHAVMEHRLNRSPEIAARVYELGLRKHASFVTIPPYVLRYAQLLLELDDIMNLRALLTRSVAACEALEKKSALAALWDMTLHFESIINGSDEASVAAIQTIERRRREALMGPDIEDVGTGGFVGVDETALIGAQKSTIGEQLVRSEGYDTSSRIVNGMSRTVDFLGVMGLWGDGDLESLRNRARAKAAGKDGEEIISGGKSDASYQKRLNYQLMAHSGLSSDAALVDGAGPGSKILSARERLQQGAAAAGPGQGTAMMLAIQQSPDWLRNLLLLLPASKLRLPIVAKPPPHLTEMALSALKQNPLPAERPADEAGSNKRALTGGDGNSSDEDDDGVGNSGYSNAFRARQRARMMQNDASQN